MFVQPNQAIKVFYSYAQEDEDLRLKLEKHLSSLRREGYINDWDKRKIGPGKEWQNEIDIHLNSSHIILLLVSKNFMYSDYCWDVELKRAMERHEAQEARVIPIILDFVDWKYALFGRLQALPRDGRPVRDCKPHDRAFENITQDIREVVKELTVPNYHTKKSLQQVGTVVIPIAKSTVKALVNLARMAVSYLFKPSRYRRYRRRTNVPIGAFIGLLVVTVLFISQLSNISELLSSDISEMSISERSPVLTKTQMLRSTGWIPIGKIDKTSSLSPEKPLLEAWIDPPVIPSQQSVVTVKYEIDLRKEKPTSPEILQKLQPGDQLLIYQVKQIPNPSQNSKYIEVWAQVRKL